MIETIILLLAGVATDHPNMWTNHWDNLPSRTLQPFDTDPYEKPFFNSTNPVEFSGVGSAYIDGKGTMSLSGDAPRYRVLEKFGDVNVTLYAKRVSEHENIDSAGFVIGARSRHYTDATCGANTYYGQLTNDGRVSFEKELFHGVGDDAFYPDVTDNNAQIFAFPDGIPKDKWIGLRFIVTSADNNTSALLQLYLDKNDNGTWQKVLEYKDTGNWPVKKGNAKCEGFYPANRVITEPGFVFIRNDGLGRADYKNLTIQEMK